MAVQTIPLNVIRTTLDGSPLINALEKRPAWNLAVLGGNNPVPRASGVYTAGETCVAHFDGEKWTVYFCDTNAVFTYWFTTYVMRTTFGNPGTPGSSGTPPNGTLEEIWFVDVPGAATIAGLCAASL